MCVIRVIAVTINYYEKTQKVPSVKRGCTRMHLDAERRKA